MNRIKRVVSEFVGIPAKLVVFGVLCMLSILIALQLIGILVQKTVAAQGKFFL